MKGVLISALLVVTSGCAVGNRYEYRQALLGLPVSGDAVVSVAVVDSRPYVVDGTKKASFVGLQRGGFGNPFDVQTSSGAPLAEELKTSISTAMAARGFTVVAGEQAAERMLRLILLEWKSDAMLRMKVLYDLELEVLDGEGSLLAAAKSSGEEVLGGGMQHQNADNAARTFELTFSQLIRDPDVQRALTSGAVSP